MPGLSLIIIIIVISSVSFCSCLVCLRYGSVNARPRNKHGNTNTIGCDLKQNWVPQLLVPVCLQKATLQLKQRIGARQW